jgi:hypothetical protein
VISNHAIATRFPVVVDIKSGALAILSIPVIHTMMIPNHIATITSIRNAIIINQNNAISINAVCFDILANAKKHQDIIIYLSDCDSISFFDLCSVCSDLCSRFCVFPLFLT